MQLFKGSYLSVAAGLDIYDLIWLSRTAQCRCIMFHLLQSEVQKNHNLERSTNET